MLFKRKRRKKLPARAVADGMGFAPMRNAPGQPGPSYGRKACIGQYVRPYKRGGALPTAGRISKGARARHERDRGTEGLLDFSGVINAHR